MTKSFIQKIIISTIIIATIGFMCYCSFLWGMISLCEKLGGELILYTPGNTEPIYTCKNVEIKKETLVNYYVYRFPYGEQLQFQKWYNETESYVVYD